MDFWSSTPQHKDSDGNIKSTMRKTSTKRARGPYMGIWPRNGKWVSEIRIPTTKEKIWLGTHDSAEAAAQAYDDASYFVHGPEGPCNFPNKKRPQCSNNLIGSKTVEEIQQIIKKSTSPGRSKVPVKKLSKLSAPCPSINKYDQLAPIEIPAPEAHSEPVVIPSFGPEEPVFPFENLPFDEAFIKEADNWILNFTADPDFPQTSGDGKKAH